VHRNGPIHVGQQRTNVTSAHVGQLAGRQNDDRDATVNGN
jgi:hypothetical protein